MEFYSRSILLVDIRPSIRLEHLGPVLPSPRILPLRGILIEAHFSIFIMAFLKLLILFIPIVTLRAIFHRESMLAILMFHREYLLKLLLTVLDVQRTE